MKHRMELAAGALAFCALLTLFACDSDLQVQQGQLAVPSQSQFPPVADAIELRCGTLDCHGQTGRNLRIYGQYGLRLSPGDQPIRPPTTASEYTATYWSVVGVEPETMSGVVQHKESPNDLSMVRKPRGIAAHKGGQLMAAGDPLDRCIVGWLVGSFDLDACTLVTQTQRPEPDAGP